MLIEQTRPSYLTCAKMVWSQICQRQVLSSLPDVIQNMNLEYSKLLNAFILHADIQMTWYKNFSKVNELSNRDNIKKFCGSQIILCNLVNSETKSRHCNNKKNLQNKKPDFKLLVNTNDEILFSTLDELVKKYRNRIGMTSFGVWICGKCPSLVVQDISGRRRSSTHSKIPIYKSNTDFGGIVQFKNSVSKVLEVITSDTLSILSCSDCCRLPPSEPIQITVVASNEK
ncbi:15790_t:CDS:2 [Gigaspora margarita]|uniref:15790_t:CDS:1 n=1 Tax=Gigaspora margarita TaxID=4874 RepID=A0ABN7UXF2_GIGMA|nr:15790_t:CDS:2 [Gigaspora margarita]